MSTHVFVTSPARLRMEEAARNARHRMSQPPASIRIVRLQHLLDDVAKREAATEREKAVQAALRSAAEKHPLPLPVRPPPWPSIPLIKAATCDHFGVSIKDIESARRSVSIVRPRQIAMYLARLMTPKSFPEIGRHFGGRDHTTVMFAAQRVQELCESEPKMASDTAAVKALIELRWKKPAHNFDGVEAGT